MRQKLIWLQGGGVEKGYDVDGRNEVDVDNVCQTTDAAFALAGVLIHLASVYPSRDCGDDPELAMALEYLVPS